MKVQVLTEHLQGKLPFINHAISQKSQLPVLLHLLLEAKNNTLTISSTDLEIGIRTHIRATVEEEGEVTVPAKMFSELILALQQGKIALQTVDNGLTITSQSSKTTLQTGDANEFPKLYQEQGKKLLSLTRAYFEQDFPKIVFAASVDTGRPALSGIFLTREASDLIAVGTDGYRLSLKRYNGPKTKDIAEPDLSIPLLIPARVIREQIAVKEDEETVVVYVSSESNQIIFEQGGTTIVGRLIDASFPAYGKIIPTSFTTSAQFDREELQKAVRICSIFARETANIIKFTLQKDKIIVSANAPSVGENSVEVEATITGEESEIAFNARYLLDLLSHISDKTLLFEMTGPLNPGVFKIKGDNSFLHLIMPIRVQ